jgi:hypothetical protein
MAALIHMFVLFMGSEKTKCEDHKFAGWKSGIDGDFYTYVIYDSEDKLTPECRKSLFNKGKLTDEQIHILVVDAMQKLKIEFQTRNLPF